MIVLYTYNNINNYIMSIVCTLTKSYYSNGICNHFHFVIRLIIAINRVTDKPENRNAKPPIPSVIKDSMIPNVLISSNILLPKLHEPTIKIVTPITVIIAPKIHDTILAHNGTNFTSCTPSSIIKLLLSNPLKDWF